MFSIAQECSGSFVNISMHNSTKLPLQYTVVCRQYTVSMQTVYSGMQTVYSKYADSMQQNGGGNY